MKRIAYWGLPILLLGALATSGFAQDPKWKDNKEYEDYIAVYNEKTDFEEGNAPRSSCRPQMRIPSP
jgi:hypothetical protein